MSKKELLEKKVNTEMSNIVIDLEADSKNSFENVDKDSVALPFLRLLQTNSPECNDSEPEYIENAKAGHFINSVTKEVLGNHVVIIPCYYKRVFNQWVDRLKGGGYKGFVNVDSKEYLNAKEDPLQFGRRVLPNGDYLTDTRNHYVLLVHNGRAIPMLLSLVSTQIKKSKNWMSQMQMIQFENAQGFLYMPPQFSHEYSIESVSESNDKGSWKGVKIRLKYAVDITQKQGIQFYQQAKAFADLVRDNKVRVEEPAREEF